MTMSDDIFSTAEWRDVPRDMSKPLQALNLVALGRNSHYPGVELVQYLHRQCREIRLLLRGRVNPRPLQNVVGDIFPAIVGRLNLGVDRPAYLALPAQPHLAFVLLHRLRLLALAGFLLRSLQLFLLPL